MNEYAATHQFLHRGLGMNFQSLVELVSGKRFSLVLLRTGFLLVLVAFFTESIRTQIGIETGATGMVLVGILFIMLGAVLEQPARK